MPQVLKGKVFNIQRYSINDGPGIRTTVFLKGCPLECLWCDNPESQKNFPELLYLDSLCTKCLRCLQMCPTGATALDQEGKIRIDRKICKTCGACVRVCLTTARTIIGQMMTVEEVMEVVNKDALFFRNSGGGVTFSGGEPCSQPEFLMDLLQESRKRGFHTSLDTSGYVPWRVLSPMLEWIDLILFDIKHMDPRKHQKLTGVDNRLILRNFKRILREGKDVIVRMPLIPGLNDSDENIDELGRWLTDSKIIEVHLLPYHRLGINKYVALSLPYPLNNTRQFDKEEPNRIKEKLKSYGLRVIIA
jgi:glycyl-radical enzyme activating protein